MTFAHEVAIVMLAWAVCSAAVMAVWSLLRRQEKAYGSEYQQVARRYERAAEEWLIRANTSRHPAERSRAIEECRRCWCEANFWYQRAEQWRGGLL